MKKNMFTETEMTSLLFTRAEENGVRSTSRENLAFKLPLNQHHGVTRQNFCDLEAVPGAAEQMPHRTVGVWHREGHCHQRPGCRLGLARAEWLTECSVTANPAVTSPQHCPALPVLVDPAHLTGSQLQQVIEIVSNVWRFKCSCAACAGSYWPPNSTL